MNNIFSAYKDMWIKAADYKGRSNVSEYWWPICINMLITVFFLYIMPMPEIVLGYNVAIALPCVSLAIRRMHDANKSGWNILWLYVPTVILLVYAGAILYYTQTPDVVDMFLKFFMAMMVSYVVFLVYSIYLLTHFTYPQKNHYGDVPYAETTREEVRLSSSENADPEKTLSFKTKAFLEKAMHRKQQDPANTPITEAKQEVQPQDTAQTATAEKKTVPVQLKALSKPTENKPVVRKPREETPAVQIKTAQKENVREEKIVMAQLKPSKARPVVKTAKQAPSSPVQTSKPFTKVPIKKEAAKVKTVAQKRTELQQTMSLSKSALKEEIRKTETTQRKPAERKTTVHHPIKRKMIQPVEVPNVNVETIRTHSLDSIAKLVEQNMNKETKDAPVVTATINKKPIKRTKKEIKS